MSVLQFWVTCGLRPGIFFSFLGPFLLHIVQVFSSKVSSVQAFNHKAAAHVLYCIVALQCTSTEGLQQHVLQP